MGAINKSDDIVLLFENYSRESEQLHTSFKQAHIDCPVVVIDSDGNTPEGVISVFDYYLGSFEGKPRYFNQVEKPRYWEISSSNSSASIHDLNKEKARIFFFSANNERHVKAVDWLDDNGVVRTTEHYNSHGYIYARTSFNKKGEKVNTAYFSAENKEVIVENYVTGDIILNSEGKTFFFKNKTEFVVHFLKSMGFDKRRIFYNSLSYPFFVSQVLGQERREDILFWQERKREDVPGNMQIILSGNSNRTKSIMVQKRAAYDKLLELGVDGNIVHKLGNIFPYIRENKGGKKALVCTNSDQIPNLEDIVKAIPDMEFNIVALTEMSSKLMTIGNYDNVRLYPGAKKKEIDKLFEECDYYLDINRFDEILDAVRRAYLNNQLIFAFSETMHNENYVAQRNIYESNKWPEMVESIQKSIDSVVMRDTLLDTQRREAMTETEDTYLSI